MFAFSFAISMAVAQAQERDEENFWNLMKDCDPEVASKMIAERAEKKEKRRLEAESLRRHNEHMEELRATRIAIICRY